MTSYERMVPVTRVARLHTSPAISHDPAYIHIRWTCNDAQFEAEGPENIVVPAYNDFVEYLACKVAQQAAALQQSLPGV